MAGDRDPRHAPRLLRVGTAAAACVLIALAAAYYLTYEPAPRIAVRWPPNIEPSRRAQLERRFLLVNREAERDRFEYDLLDTSRDNVEALVREPDVADTDRISREWFTVPFDVPYGTSWMWIAHRTPVLRVPGVVAAIVVICVIALAAAVAGEVRYFRGKRMRR